MIFNETEIKGAYIIELEKFEDDRGFFARSWCQREFETHGLNPKIAQCNVSFNAKKGTMRGMHYQYPKWEAKLVRATKGSIYDVIVDLRPESPTYLKHIGIELSDNNGKMLYVPERFGHGFLTLEDNTEVFYQMSEFYIPENARGFRYDDSAFGIEWPREVTVVSDRDKNYPDFELNDLK